MPLVQFMEFMIKAREKAEEERLRANWVSMLPFMSLGLLKFMPFDAYCEQASGKNIDRRPTAEIVAELEALHGEKLI